MTLHFKHKAKAFSPIVVYFDLLSIFEKVHSVPNDPEKSHSRLIEKHTQSGYCFAAVEHDCSSLFRYRLKRGPGYMIDFVDQMEKLACDIHYRKEQHRVFSGTIPTDKQKSKAKSCWICERDFDDSDVNVLDHFHFKGKFLGWAHDVCNINRKTQNFAPIIAHNLSHYNLHHLCNALHNCHSRNKFTIIQNTDETYISLTLKVFIEEHAGQRNRLIQVYEDLGFLDSFRFMNTSLEKLVDSLPGDSFKLLDKHFEDYQTSDIKLLHGKVFYPYSYIDSFDRFKESKLAPLNSWINHCQVKTTYRLSQKLEKAQQIFGNFDSFNLGDYHDLYLSVDTLQLADDFEKFRTLCFQRYGLDCAQYFSAPNLAGDAFLKTWEPELELLTNRDHLDFVENLMRGGMASVFCETVFLKPIMNIFPTVLTRTRSIVSV